jgi:pimeloyl-ACP methyl ester carboxylesterase
VLLRGKEAFARSDMLNGCYMTDELFTRHRTTVKGLSIHFLRSGHAGPPLLLLHGGSSDSALLSWSSAIPRFAENFNVMAPDFPGFGESDKPRISFDAEYLTDFTETFLEQQGIERVSVVGLSMGGLVALKLALRKPNRLSALVLVDSVGLGTGFPYNRLVYPLIRLPISAALRGIAKRSKQAIRAALTRIVFSPTCLTEELVDQIYSEVRRPGAGHAWGSFLRHELCWGGFRQDLSARLSELRTPILLVHGKNDRLIPVEHALRAKRQCPHARLEIFPECGHWPPREKPGEFNQVVLEFLLDQSRFHSTRPIIPL